MEHSGHSATATGMKHEGGDMYRRLLGMAALSFIAMYGLMYAMVNSFGNVLNSLNQVYMAALMTGAMMIIELAVMRGMYTNKRLNGILFGASIAILAIGWFGIRRQVAIGDRQFLRSMVPHHAGAILMCQQASITDPKIQQLCQGIVSSQQSEIAQMKEMLNAR